MPEYVIGIDFGHGETAAAICPIGWERSVGQLEVPEDITIGNGSDQRVLLSAIKVVNNRDVYIGESALSGSGEGHAYVCFKKAPQDINGEYEQLMIKFMAAVYGRILDKKRGFLTGINHIVYIAAPSGWTNDEVELYREMANNAGIPIGGIMRESRAALLHAQHSDKLGIKQDIEQGVVVFDLGSSTLDLTYYSNKISHPIDQGYECGASYVEKQLLSHLKEKDQQTRDFLRKYPDKEHSLLYGLRKQKESYYSDERGWKETIIVNYSDIVPRDRQLLGQNSYIYFEEDDGLTIMLNKSGYQRQLTNALAHFKENYIDKGEIKYVVLTGGALNMKFVRNLICDCWKIEESRIKTDGEPSLTISRGISEAARMDMRTSKAIEDIETEIEKIDVTHIKQQVLAIYPEKFASQIGEYLTEKSNNWENASSDNEVKNQIKQELENFNKNGSLQKRILSNIIKECTETIIRENGIQDKVNAVVAEYAQTGFSVGINIKEISLTNISETKLLEMVNAIDSVPEWLKPLEWYNIFSLPFDVLGMFVDELFFNNDRTRITRIIRKYKENVESTLKNSTNSNGELERAVNSYISLIKTAYLTELRRIRKLIA